MSTISQYLDREKADKAREGRNKRTKEINIREA